MSPLVKRSISGIVYITLFLSSILYSQTSYIVLIFLFGLIGLWEFNKIIKLKNIIPYILFPVIAYLCKDKLNEAIIFKILLIVLISSFQLIYTLFTPLDKNSKSFLTKISLGIRYVILPFTFLILLPFVNSVYNPYIILFVSVIIWTNDVFAFLVGKNFGKHKLLSQISPKKTIEGFAGGLLFSIIAGVLIGIYSGIFNTLNWIIIALIVSVFGNLGDLVESKFKREANVKDSGNIMPGHGGILDRLDSLFFLAPFVYLYVHYLI